MLLGAFKDLRPSRAPLIRRLALGRDKRVADGWAFPAQANFSTRGRSSTGTFLSGTVWSMMTAEAAMAGAQGEAGGLEAAGEPPAAVEEGVARARVAAGWATAVVARATAVAGTVGTRSPRRF